MIHHVSLGTHDVPHARAFCGGAPQYDAHYYGAFVRDPDGNKVEAVTFSAK